MKLRLMLLATLIGGSVWAAPTKATADRQNLARIDVLPAEGTVQLVEKAKDVSWEQPRWFAQGRGGVLQFAAAPESREGSCKLKAEAEGASAGLATMEEFMENRYGSVSLPAAMSDDEFRTLLLDENNREFYAEGRRWFDIKRLYLSDVSTAKPFRGGFNEWASEHSFLWPVPQNQIDIAGKENYPQNPNY